MKFLLTTLALLALLCGQSIAARRPNVSLVLTDDPGESTDLAARHPNIVTRLQNLATTFDTAFQPGIRPVLRLPGPPQPAPRQVRTVSNSITEWQNLINEPTQQGR